MLNARLRPAALLPVLCALALSPATSLYAQKCTAPSFAVPALTFGVSGSWPSDVVTADFNRDGLLDVAVVNEVSNSLSVLLGTGGGFTLPATTLDVNSAFALAASDLDHDGNPDIAVAGQSSNEIVVFLGDGAGGFTGPGLVPVAQNGPSAIEIGDFNKDGNPDLLVGYTGGPGVAAHLGAGDGSFGAGSFHSMGFTSELAIGDVDQDGNLDVVATDNGSSTLYTSLGIGDGKFQPPIGSATGNNPFGLTLGDFDRDGNLDVVTVDQGDASFSFMRGQGNGVFNQVSSIPGAGALERVVSGDFDGDGILDVVFPNTTDFQVSVFLGDGAGDFPVWNVFGAPGDARDAIAGDFDRDGRLDIVATLSDTNEIALFTNDYGTPCLNPSFAQVGSVLVAGANPLAVVSGDFNGDFHEDFVTADQGSSTVTFHSGSPNGTFGPPVTFTTGAGPVSIAAADFTSDGILDLVTANAGSNDVSFLRNTGGGSFAAPVSLPLSGTPVEVAVADLNFDGKIDLAVSLDAADVVVALGDGTGNFSAFTPFFVGTSPGSLTAGDFDNDGILDLAVAETSANEIVTLKGLGDGSFTVGANNPITGGAPTSVRAGHLDGDGNLDVVVTVGTGGGGAVKVALGDGVLGLSEQTPQILAGGPTTVHGLAVADVDGDGTDDAVVANAGVSAVDVLLGTGAGGLSPPLRFPTGEGPGAVAIDDFNRDGSLDLLATQPTDASVWVMPGDGVGGFAPDFFPSSGTDTRNVASGDFNRDGIPDLVVANAGSDSLTRFLGTGGGGFGAGLDMPLGISLKPVWVTVDDFDRDGNLDVVSVNQGLPDVTFFRGDGTGGFQPPVPTILSSSPSMVRSADFDFDGLPDLAVLEGSSVELLKGGLGGAFTFAGVVSIGSTGAGLVVEDFDRDGDVDIAVTRVTNDTLRIYWSAGPGFNFTAGPTWTLSAAPRDFDVADFNGDGYLDFVVPSDQLSRVQLVVSAGGPLWSPGTTLGVPKEPMTARAADINGDGNADFVVASRGGHVLSFFTGDGAGGVSLQVDKTVGLRSPVWMTMADLDGDSRPDIAVVPDTSASPTTDGVAVILNTNCLPTRLVTSTDPSSCHASGTPFTTQPELFVEDDGGNLIQCNLDPVTAAIVPGTGTAGAALSGTNPVTPVGGTATFTDLAIDLPGGGYQIIFSHPSAGLSFSRSFSQGLTVTITGPLAVCEGDPAVYDGGAGYGMYDWLLDTTPVSMAPQVDLTATLTAGLHTLDLTVWKDSCTAFDSISIDVTANLSGVTISPTVPQSVCTTCTGATISSTLTGGGSSTYQWGYRTVSLGTITPITGATGANYTIQGPDFPGVGTYYLVVTATPTCGAALVSNEVQVDVTATAGPSPLIALTARSGNVENFLEWATPTIGPCNSVRILRRSDKFPTGPNDPSATVVGGADFPCVVGGKSSFGDLSLTNDQKYYYSGFVSDGATFSSRKDVTGRPFDNTVGNVLWSYTTGATSLAPPGLRIQAGVGTIYIVSNDNLVHSVDPNGFWPASWKPAVLGGPAQSRPPVPSFPVGLPGPAQAANGAVFVGAQDGDLYVLDADEGDLVWQQNVGPIVQAAPAAIFGAFGGAQNLVMVGTRDNASPNTFRAFDVDDGTPIWTFQNSSPQGGDNSIIGIISGGASVDYANQRVFFASHKEKSGGKWSLWSLDFSSGSPMLQWSQDYGDIETSPIYLGGTPARLVVANTAGDVFMVDADAGGGLVWSSPFNAGDGAVKGFVFPQFGSPNYLFSTLNNVWSIRDNGPGANATQNWKVAVPKASMPLFVPGTTAALVGGDSGTLHQINGVDTATPTTTSVTLGDGLSIVGAPTFQGATGIIFVGTDEGVIYAVQYPIP